MPFPRPLLPLPLLPLPLPLLPLPLLPLPLFPLSSSLSPSLSSSFFWVVDVGAIIVLEVNFDGAVVALVVAVAAVVVVAPVVVVPPTIVVDAPAVAVVLAVERRGLPQSLFAAAARSLFGRDATYSP